MNHEAELNRIAALAAMFLLFLPKKGRYIREVKLSFGLIWFLAGGFCLSLRSQLSLGAFGLSSALLLMLGYRNVWATQESNSRALPWLLFLMLACFFPDGYLWSIALGIYAFFEREYVWDLLFAVLVTKSSLLSQTFALSHGQNLTSIALLDAMATCLLAIVALTLQPVLAVKQNRLFYYWG